MWPMNTIIFGPGSPAPACTAGCGEHRETTCGRGRIGWGPSTASSLPRPLRFQVTSKGIQGSLGRELLSKWEETLAVASLLWSIVKNQATTPQKTVAESDFGACPNKCLVLGAGWWRRRAMGFLYSTIMSTLCSLLFPGPHARRSPVCGLMVPLSHQNSALEEDLTFMPLYSQHSTST